tara:strand:- start:1296 stop:1607 length:312 start_codon:yes stop_codon:yes gene_type:complete
MTGQVMNKVNDELLTDLRDDADQLKKGLENGNYPDMQSIIKALCKVTSSSAHVLVAIAGEGVVTVDECTTHRRLYQKAQGDWKKTAVICGTILTIVIPIIWKF